MAAGDKGTAGPLLTRRLAVPVAVFLGARLVTLAVAHVARRIRIQELIAVLWRWDGQHYLTIVRDGYPSAVPDGSGPAAQSVHAFFPGFPILIRGVREVTGLATATAGVATTIAFGTLAAVLVWLLARDLGGEEVATRAVLLFSFFPGAFVFGYIYSEAPFIAFSAACLLALHRRSWVVAGLAAAAAGATRPTGLVLVLCCAWAAVEAVRASPRDRRAVIAPLLALTGFLAWSVFLAIRTGSPITWIRSQDRGWGQGFDFGAHTARSIGSFLAEPLEDLNRAVCVLTILLVAAVLLLLWSWRPPVILLVYTAGILFPALFSAVLTSTPRFALTAFPLHIAAARRLEGTAFAVVLALSASCMAALMLVTAISPLVTP